ncbi:MAG: 4Fe-4S binding protein [Anaerolineae bacterium]|nr:4Fe-4S binding protein [Anaerolineae bacterium]
MLILRAIALSGFIFAIFTGLLGTQVGNRNFSIIMVWILWWAALILMVVPVLGRGWCAVCPIPMPGEWLQNGAVLSPKHGSKKSISGRRFPKIFRNIWLQNGAFSLMAIFSAVILTRPQVTAWILLSMIVVAVATSTRFERRSFCRYMCPVGGFIGLYAQLAPLELRVLDTKVCAGHKEKSCYRGNEDGYGCPWDVYPGGLTLNTNCGLCMECLRTCEYDNLALNLRPLGSDLKKSRRRGLDESLKAFIMLGSAIVYAAVMLGPWGMLKDAAYQIGSTAWLGYAGGLLFFTWGFLPGLFYIATRAALKYFPSDQKPDQAFNNYATATLPLGLTAWIAFSISFVFTNISYLGPILSDPFGWGWDLFNTAGLGWSPYMAKIIPMLQIGVIAGGLYWAGNVLQSIAVEHKAPQQAWPLIIFCTLVSIGLLWLLVG